MKKEQLEYTILLSVGCLVILYICYVFLIVPQWKKLKQSKKIQNELTTKLNVARGKVRRLPILKKNVKTLQNEIDSEEKQLFDNRFELFVKMVKEATKKSGLKINNIHPDKNVDIQRSKYYKEKWVSLETHVPYHVLGKWLDELENQSKYLRIIKLSIVSKPDDIGVHKAKVTIGFLIKTNAK